MKSGHVEIRSTAAGVDVITDDLEVFDYVDDVLTGSGLESEFTLEEERNGQRLYVMHFGVDFAEERIAKALEGIPEGEIERIWKINNDTPDRSH